MMMDSFERKMKQLPLVNPSEELNERIFRYNKKKSKVPGIFYHRISFGWAFSVALVTLLVGFIISSFWMNYDMKMQDYAQKSIHIQIVQSTEGNFMDFTRTSDDFLKGEVAVNLETTGDKKQ